MGKKILKIQIKSSDLNIIKEKKIILSRFISNAINNINIQNLKKLNEEIKIDKQEYVNTSISIDIFTIERLKYLSKELSIPQKNIIELLLQYEIKQLKIN